MPITVVKLNTVSYVGGGKLDVHFLAYRSDAVDEIALAVYNASSLTEEGFPREWQGRKIDHLGGGVWKFVVPYGVGDYPVQAVPGAPAAGGGGGAGGTPPPPPPPMPQDNDPLGRNWDFDFTGGTTHITTAEARVFSTGLGGTIAPETNHAIGLSDGKVEGTDVFTSTMKMTYSCRIPVMTQAYAKTLRELSCCVNSVRFMGREAGEILFLGARLTWTMTEGYTGNFQFLESKNQTDVQIGPPGNGLLVPLKNGWDYLWVAYEQAASGGAVVAQPFAVYVDRVYDYKDLNRLGLFS